MAGSISWFLNALVSQCEVEEPGTIGSGAYNRARPAGLAPARTVRSRPSVAVTGRLARIRLPSGKVTRTDGMVMVGSAPPKPAGGAPAALSATTTAIAPAFCAFFTFTMNPQVPRVTSAMLPATAPALVRGEQASKVVGPAPSAGSNAATIVPVMPAEERAEPKAAVPTAYLPKAAPAVVTFRFGVPNERTLGTAASTCEPVQIT